MSTTSSEAPVEAPRSRAERAYDSLISLNEVDRAGPLASREQPERFSAALRAALRRPR